MRFSLTYGLVAVLAVLGGATWYFRWYEPARTPTPTTTTAQVYDIPVADVRRMEVIEGGRAAAVERRDDAIWGIVYPAAEEADSRRVDDAVGRISRLTATRRLEGVDPAEYDLISPQTRLRLTTRDGAIRELLVGARTPDGSAYYVRPVEEMIVYVAGSFAISDVTRWLAEPPRPRPTPTALAPLPTRLPAP